MGRVSTLKVAAVNLTKYIDTGNGNWRYCPVVRSSNGRVKPDHVLVGGRIELHREGSYSLDWYENGSRRRKSVGKSAVDAAAAEHLQCQILANRALGLKVDGDEKSLNRTTVGDAAAEFLEEIQQQRRPKTHQQYTVALRYFESFCGSTRRVVDVQRKDLLTFMAHLRNEKRVSQRTIWTKLNVVVQLLKANGIVGLLKKGDWPRYVQSEPDVYSREELETFLAHCDGVEKIVFEFFWMTGFRDAEVQYVMKKDVDLKEQVVRVSEKSHFGFIPKDWEQREVPIPDQLAHSLEQHLKRLPGNSDLLFPTSGGQPNYHFLAQCKKIAFDASLNCGRCETGSKPCDVGPYCEQWYLHKFRSTFATMHLRAGVDLATVQQWMGHKDLASTMRYLKPARGKVVLEKVNNTFGRPAPILVKSGS